MGLEGAEQTLVIILSVALAVLLVLSIIAVYKLISILSAIKRLTDKAEHIAEAAESISASMKNAFSAASAGRFLNRIIRSFSGEKKAKKGPDQR